MTTSSEGGSALLMVLIVLASLSALSLSALDAINRERRLSENADFRSRARWAAAGALDYALASAGRIRREDSIDGLNDGGRLTLSTATDVGAARIEVWDGSTCINLNGSVIGAGDVFEPSAEGMARIRSIAVHAGLSQSLANDIAAHLAGWIVPDGPDDAAYIQARPSYLSGETPLAHESEMLSIRNVTPQAFDKLQDLTCALPVTGRSPVNINALTVDKASVLSALTSDSLSIALARDLLTTRPKGGWRTLGDALESVAGQRAEIPDAALSDILLTPDFLRFRIVIAEQGASMTMSARAQWAGDSYILTSMSWSDEQ